MKMYNINVPDKFQNTKLHSFYFLINTLTPLIVLGWTIFQVYNYFQLKSIQNQLKESTASFKLMQDTAAGVNANDSTTVSKNNT